MRRWGLVVVAACATSAAPQRPVGVVKTSVLRVPPSAPRLPRDFVPIGYRARLKIGDGLTGHIEITGKVVRETSIVWLDSDGLEIHAAHAERDGKIVRLVAQRTRWDAGETEKLALQSAVPLSPGPLTLVVDYSAEIVDQSVTADRGDWGAVAAATEHVFRESPQDLPYVFTNFEPMGARRAFPCFDEPDLKVPWQLAFDVPESVDVAGNTPIKSQIALSGDRKLVELAPTRPLPSYLIAFAIGTLDVAASGSSASGVPVRVLVPHGWQKYAVPVDLAIRSLDLLEAWTGVPYPYGKLDLVAVPVTGAHWSAMENAGLVMYAATEAKDGDAAITIAHELAHHWFGNLVTLAWWDDIWLNEAFASFMASKLLPDLDPKTDPKRDLRVRQWLFDNLSLRRAVYPVRPAMRPSTTSEELAPYFDGTHGAAILRMIERFAGDDTFRGAMHDYLAAHADHNATTRDLIEALDRATGASWTAVLDAYLDKLDLPTLTFAVDCSGARPKLSLFTPPLEHWTVPVCVAYDSDGTRSEQCAMVTGGRELALESGSCPSWVYPDVAAEGLYNTRLTRDQVVALIDHGWPQLTPVERNSVFSRAPDAAFLPLVSKLVAAGDDDALIAAARILRVAASDVPARMVVAPRAAWITQHFARFARDMAFELPRYGPWNGEHYILELVAAARDPRLVGLATALAQHLDGVDPRVQHVVLGLALAAHPARLRETLDGAGTLDEAHRAILASALERVPETLDAFVQDPKRQGPFTLKQLAAILVATCDPTTRDRAAAIAATLPGDAPKTTVERLDACIDARKRLDERLKRELGI